MKAGTSTQKRLIFLKMNDNRLIDALKLLEISAKAIHKSAEIIAEVQREGDFNNIQVKKPDLTIVDKEE